jgi:glycerol uptake facilitator-like aquaporin
MAERLAGGNIGIAHSSWYVFVQITGGLAGMLAAHLMFDETLIQFSQQVRNGGAQWFAEVIAAFG